MNFLDFSKEYRHVLKKIDERDFSSFTELNSVDLRFITKRLKYTAIGAVKDALSKLYERRKAEFYESFNFTHSPDTPKDLPECRNEFPWYN